MEFDVRLLYYNQLKLKVLVQQKYNNTCKNLVTKFWSGHGRTSLTACYALVIMAIYIGILTYPTEITLNSKIAWYVYHVSPMERFQRASTSKSYNFVILFFQMLKFKL